MTSLVLKLIGNSTQEHCVTIQKPYIGINDIMSYLLTNSVSFKELENINFIHKGQNITNDIEAKYSSELEPLVIYIFSSSNEIRQELNKCIFNDDLVELSLNDFKNSTTLEPLEDTLETIDEEDKQNININTIKLFEDSEFVNLLRICINKPQLLNQVTSYIMNGSVTSEIKTIQLENFNYPSEYNNINNILDSLNITIDEIKIKSVIQHFEGHINLSVRYLLYYSINN
jgi:hypothetical protein